MKLQLRRDSTVNWEANNPVLLLGEPGYDTDLKQMRIGDGSTSWTGLTPFGGGGGGGGGLTLLSTHVQADNSLVLSVDSARIEADNGLVVQVVGIPEHEPVNGYVIDFKWSTADGNSVPELWGYGPYFNENNNVVDGSLDSGVQTPEGYGAWNVRYWGLMRYFPPPESKRNPADNYGNYSQYRNAMDNDWADTGWGDNVYDANTATSLPSTDFHMRIDCRMGCGFVRGDFNYVIGRRTRPTDQDPWYSSAANCGWFNFEDKIESNTLTSLGFILYIAGTAAHVPAEFWSNFSITIYTY